MPITTTELMLNKTKCHALETIGKVSRAASQQLRRGFIVCAKSQLRNACWVHKEDLASSTHPGLSCRRLLIKVLCSHQTSGWELERKNKNKSFSTAFKPGCRLLRPFCNKCVFVSGVTLHWKAPQCSQEVLVQPQHLHSPPKKVKRPKFLHLQGFLCPCHIYSWNIWSWSGQLLLLWLQLVRNATVAQVSVATYIWNTILITILAIASFSFGAYFFFTCSFGKAMLSTGSKGLENRPVFCRDAGYYLNRRPVCCTLMLLMERKRKHEVWTSLLVPLH